MTYLILSLPFLLGAAALWWSRRRAFARQSSVTVLVAAIVLTLTIIFDNLMVAAGLVEYDTSNNLGIYLGLIPIEDLFYSVFVCLIVAAVWPERTR